jgi:hypothetical protein
MVAERVQAREARWDMSPWISSMAVDRDLPRWKWKSPSPSPSPSPSISSIVAGNTRLKPPEAV